MTKKRYYYQGTAFYTKGGAGAAKVRGQHIRGESSKVERALITTTCFRTITGKQALRAAIQRALRGDAMGFSSALSDFEGNTTRDLGVERIFDAIDWLVGANWTGEGPNWGFPAKVRKVVGFFRRPKIRYRGTTCRHCGNHFVGSIRAMEDRECGRCPEPLDPGDIECDYCEKPSTHVEEGDTQSEICYFCDDHYRAFVLSYPATTERIF